MTHLLLDIFSCRMSAKCYITCDSLNTKCPNLSVSLGAPIFQTCFAHTGRVLSAYRKPFVPPPADKPVIVRSIHYQGEEHPVALKRVIVVPVDSLPLKDDAALHKAILLAGPRWSPVPHADSGVSGNDLWGNGYIKIACEDFPKASLNLKWASDTLDKIVAEANVSTSYTCCAIF